MVTVILSHGMRQPSSVSRQLRAAGGGIEAITVNRQFERLSEPLFQLSTGLIRCKSIRIKTPETLT